MPSLDYNTYISLLIGAVLIEFVGVFLKLLISDKSISREKKFLTTYVSIIVYGIIAFTLTILYKKISISDFINFFRAFKHSADYIHENVLNHWYNFLFPWINNNIKNSIFDSIILICFWLIISIIFITPMITNVIDNFINFYKVNKKDRKRSKPLEKLDASFGLCRCPFYITLASVTPMTVFYFFNTFYIALNYSIRATVIFIISITLIITYLIIGGCIIHIDKAQ